MLPVFGRPCEGQPDAMVVDGTALIGVNSPAINAQLNPTCLPGSDIGVQIAKLMRHATQVAVRSDSAEPLQLATVRCDRVA
jgi:hypothetical protein